MKRALCPLVAGVLLAVLIPTGNAQRPSKGTHPGQEPNAAILYTDSVAFTITPPAGWVLDDQAGRAQGALAVLYRRGESWSDGGAVMYGNVGNRDRDAPTLQKGIANDIAAARRANPKAVVSPAPSLPAGPHGKAVVYDFQNAWQAGARERAAYVSTPKAFLIFVLTAHSQKPFDKAAPDFAALLRSYALLTNAVRIESGRTHRHAKD